ncbi:MAG: VWA domain-containing protein [Kiritimatiellae bacterium]|nr:VWA domain-containing protein [Kiritimatiellia bacterium]
MRFANPFLLFLCVLVPLAGLYWTFLRARREKAIARFSLNSREPGGKAGSVQFVFALAGLFLCLFAASRPQWGKATDVYVKRSRNLVVALDVSNSMLVRDVRPDRLGRAKADIADLIDSLGDDRCALVAFRHGGVCICPLTTDHGFLRSALESMTPDSAPRGETDLGGAIRASLDALDPAADDHSAIIIISDGGDLRGEVRECVALAKQRGVPVFTVGIGDAGRDTEIPGLQFKGQSVKVRLEEGTLKFIADETGGRYVPLATAGTAETTLGAIYRRFLRQVAEKEQREEDERAGERFGFFLVPGICLLLAAASLSRGRFKSRKI